MHTHTHTHYRNSTDTDWWHLTLLGALRNIASKGKSDIRYKISPSTQLINWKSVHDVELEASYHCYLVILSYFSTSTSPQNINMFLSHCRPKWRDVKLEVENCPALTITFASFEFQFLNFNRLRTLESEKSTVCILCFLIPFLILLVKPVLPLWFHFPLIIPY